VVAHDYALEGKTTRSWKRLGCGGPATQQRPPGARVR
jgi:hypothetical protein